MGQRFSVRDFLEAYRAAFRDFDVPAIADLFSYPCQLTSDSGQIVVTPVATREAWVPELERLVDAYRGIGVRSAEIIELAPTELTQRLAQAAVRWVLVGTDGSPLYEFDGVYTLADLGQGMRITAIAHNETSRLRALLERHRS